MIRLVAQGYIGFSTFGEAEDYRPSLYDEVNMSSNCTDKNKV